MFAVTTRNSRAARNFLSALVVSLALIGATACGDDNDNGLGPGGLEGLYRLESAGGFNVPATFPLGPSRFEIRSGTLVLQDGLFEATVAVEMDDVPSLLTTDGSYDQNGNRILFTGLDQDGLDVSLTGIIDGNTISITDPETGLALVFRKN
ncbi:MAG: hypothetical protein M3466_15030 [Gemmatimonadota bacterium]|nr:hypothetical protein [Gemmatimonadota bacterium]